MIKLLDEFVDRCLKCKDPKTAVEGLRLAKTRVAFHRDHAAAV